MFDGKAIISNMRSAPEETISRTRGMFDGRKVLSNMRSHRVTGPVALGLIGAACCLGVSGCAQFDKALGQQQVNVYFTESTSVAFKLKVRAACNNLPDVKAIPIATGVPLASAVDIVSYNTTGAGVVQITALEECVNKFAPQVEGVDVTDASDDS
jgi:hypothetical protein